jgi:putative hemolysin
LPAVLTSDSLTATAMSPACIDSTVTAALAVVNGKCLALAASARVAVLTEGVRKNMFVKKIGIVAGALIVLTLVTEAGGHFSATNAVATEVPQGSGSQRPVGPEEGPALPGRLVPLAERTSARAEIPELKKEEPKKEPAPKKEPEPITLKGHTAEVYSVCFSPDGKRILTGGGVLTPRGPSQGPGEVKVWDAEKGTEILALKGHTNRVLSACFSPDGKRIASTGSDITLRVWDAEKGQELFKVRARAKAGVCFSPDGKRIASAGEDKMVRVWDAEKGQELLALKGHTGPVSGVCFSPDGKRIASASLDNTVRVWDTEKGQELLTLKAGTGNVLGVCFSPDGKRIASDSNDQTVKVWDAEKGQELLALKGHTGPVRGVCFSPDGKRIASASYDQTVKVWSLDKEK